MKTLVLEWQRLLDEQKETCPRCGSTEQKAEKAVKELNQMLAPSDITVNLVKKAIDPETFKKDALQSNKILIAGKTLEEWLGATTGQSKCCELAAECALSGADSVAFVAERLLARSKDRRQGV